MKQRFWWHTAPLLERGRQVALVAMLLVVGVGALTTTPTAFARQSHPQAPTPASANTSLMITTTSLPDGNQCAAYMAFINANEGDATAPDTWTIISGVLPAGLSMPSSWSYESTAIDSTPTTVQTTSFTVQVQDSAGETATRSFSLTIDQPLPLQITSPTPANAVVGTSYTTRLTASGGCRPYTWSITAGQLPPGFRLITNNYGTHITGMPTTKGTYTFTETVMDNTGLHASSQFSITVS